MTDRMWNMVDHFSEELRELYDEMHAAEKDMNYGLARLLAQRIKAADGVRDRTLGRIGGAAIVAEQLERTVSIRKYA